MNTYNSKSFVGVSRTRIYCRPLESRLCGTAKYDCSVAASRESELPHDNFYCVETKQVPQPVKCSRWPTYVSIAVLVMSIVTYDLSIILLSARYKYVCEIKFLSLIITGTDHEFPNDKIIAFWKTSQ